MKSKNLPASGSKPVARPSGQFMPALRASLLVFLLFFPLTFLHLLVHEGGHALVNLALKIPKTSIYIHPFSFSGFSRPVADWNNVWMHLGGPILSVLLGVVLFTLFWKRRNYSNLLLMLFIAWTAYWEGTGFMDILGGGGDFSNVMRITGLPASLFIAIDLLLFIAGILLFVSLLPLFGLEPKNLNTLWALPLGMLAYALVGVGVANTLVPGSPIDLTYNLAGEIITSASFRPLLMSVSGLIFAILFVTLFRFLSRKLPAFLKTEGRPLSWRDLGWPAVVAAVSVLIGLVIIL